MSGWLPGEVPTATAEGVRREEGWVNGPLGVFRLVPAGRRSTWEVVHLATGHAIAELEGGRFRAQGAAETLLALGDWTWTSLDGWRNVDPELPARVAAWLETRPDLRRGGAGQGRYEAAAREIATSAA